MNFRALIVALLLPSIAFAEGPLPTANVTTYPPGEDVINVVKKGEPAPYTGQLFDDKTALRWAVWLQQYKTLYGLDMQAQKASCDVKVAHEEELRRIDAERNTKSEADLRQRLLASETARAKAEETLRNPPFWKEPGFWYGAGVVTSVAAVVAVVAAQR
jgi:hypothetical protein